MHPRVSKTALSEREREGGWEGKRRSQKKFELRCRLRAIVTDNVLRLRVFTELKSSRKGECSEYIWH